jgi:hypothetical protein
VSVAPVLERVGEFAAYLDEAEDAKAIAALRRSGSTGRPVGTPEWLAALEASTKRKLAPGKRGPRPKARADVDQAELFSAVNVIPEARCDSPFAPVTVWSSAMNSASEGFPQHKSADEGP